MHSHTVCKRAQACKLKKVFSNQSMQSMLLRKHFVPNFKIAADWLALTT